MPDRSAQIDVVRRFYGAAGDLDVIRSVVADDAQWDVVEDFPNGGVYEGLDAIVGEFFGFFGRFREFSAVGDEFFADGDHVVVLGRYLAVGDGGREAVSRFAHFFTLRDGRIVRLRQTCDTLPLARALES